MCYQDLLKRRAKLLRLAARAERQLRIVEQQLDVIEEAASHEHMMKLESIVCRREGFADYVLETLTALPLSPNIESPPSGRGPVAKE